MLKLKNIFFRNNETFSDSDKEIKIHFLYAGEEYLFYYCNNKEFKDTLIFNEHSCEVIYRNYIDINRNEKSSEFAQIFNEAFLESLKKTKLGKFFNVDFIDIVRFYDDWN